MSRFAFALPILVAAGTVAVAQSSDPAWLDDVRDEAAVQLQCEVTYFLNIREGKLAGRRTFETRIQCLDGRQYDASRIEPDKVFRFQECGVQVC